ncbi:MAG: sensor/response regulatory hybrid protein, partial [Clostridia bacterium]|nr:sensor/response regulatory hybrid protein [Deltaproteobacteria bacterium]
NLLANAVKFTPAGSVTLRTELVESGNAQVRLRFLVRDTGIGIAKADQQRIFDAFSQADGATTRRFGGTGLGLTISAALVRLMGGHVNVESDVGRGSTFSFDAMFARP